MPETIQKLFLEPTAVVEDQANFRRAQLIFRNLPVSDRTLPDSMMDVFRDLDGEGVQLWAPEEFVPYPLIDTAWDGDERYLRKFLSFDRCKYPQKDKYLFLFLKVRHPNLYRHLIR